MQDWVMLGQPGLLLLYGLGLSCGVIDRKWKASKGWLTWIGGAVVIAVAAYLILSGASLWETSAWLIVFLLITMGVTE